MKGKGSFLVLVLLAGAMAEPAGVAAPAEDAAGAAADNGSKIALHPEYLSTLREIMTSQKQLMLGTDEPSGQQNSSNWCMDWQRCQDIPRLQCRSGIMDCTALSSGSILKYDYAEISYCNRSQVGDGGSGEVASASTGIIPEPMTAVGFLMGLAGLAGYMRRRRLHCHIDDR